MTRGLITGECNLNPGATEKGGSKSSKIHRGEDYKITKETRRLKNNEQNKTEVQNIPLKKKKQRNTKTRTTTTFYYLSRKKIAWS